MNCPKVSIIIPVYKVKDYLEKCLDSVESQTYSNLEIVLIDDGSPDECGLMCDRYKEKSNKSVKVIHQNNQGLSAARNNGVKESSGEYIVFLDSDDYISEDCIEYLVSLVQKYNCDISIGNYLPVYQNDTPVRSEKREVELVLSPEEALIEAYYSVKYGVAAWAKLYKRFLIEKYPYPVGVLYEELATTYKILGDAQSVVYGNRDIYFYVQRTGSIMSRIGERELYGLTAAQQLLDYTEKRYPRAVHAAKVRYEIKVLQYMPAVFYEKQNERYFKQLRAEALKYSKETLFDRKAGMNFSIKLLSVVLGKPAARIVYKAISKRKYGVVCKGNEKNG